MGIQFCSFITSHLHMCVHMWCHAEFHVEIKFSTRQDMASYMAFTWHEIYLTWYLHDMKLEHTWTIHAGIHEDDYWHDKPQYNHAGKWIVTNYIVLSVTLYFASIDTKQAWQQIFSQQLKRSPTKPLWCQHCIVFKYHFNNISIT